MKKKLIVLFIGIPLIIGVALFLIPLLSPTVGLRLIFDEQTELRDETKTYLSSIVPSSWLATSFFQRPRYELKIQAAYQLIPECYVHVGYYNRYRVEIQLSLRDLETNQLLAEEAFGGLDLPSCADSQADNAYVFGSWPAQAHLETWLLDNLDGSEGLSLIDRSSLERSGIIPMADTETVQAFLAPTVPETALVGFDARPAYMLTAIQRNTTIQICENEIIELKITVIRKDVYVSVIDMENGQVVLADLFVGQDPEECTETVEIDLSLEGEGVDFDQEIVGLFPRGTLIWTWLNDNLEYLPNAIP